MFINTPSWSPDMKNRSGYLAVVTLQVFVGSVTEDGPSDLS